MRPLFGFNLDISQLQFEPRSVAELPPKLVCENRFNASERCLFCVFHHQGSKFYPRLERADPSGKLLNHHQGVDFVRFHHDFVSESTGHGLCQQESPQELGWYRS